MKRKRKFMHKVFTCRNMFLALYWLFCLCLLLIFIFTFLRYLPLYSGQSERHSEPMVAKDPILARIKKQQKIRFILLDESGKFNPSRMHLLQTHTDYLLAKDFAEHMQVDFTLIQAKSLAEVRQYLAEGKADIAIGVQILPELKTIYHFSTSYRKVEKHLIYHKADQKPAKLSDLNGGIGVVSGSYHALNLGYLKQKYPQLDTFEQAGIRLRELLSKLNARTIPYTLLTDHEYRTYKHIFPNLAIASNLKQKMNLNRTIGWAIESKNNTRLLTEINLFLSKSLEQEKILHWLQEQREITDNMNAYEDKIFLRNIDHKLSQYMDLFKGAATQYHLDWKLLAAIAYQESHWDPNAVSYTGVRGIMMLTQKTAKSLGVYDRTDVSTNIYGGAKYFADLKQQFAEVAEPDRTWFALAAYNLGPSHIKAARRITQKLKGDAKLWFSVKKKLFLLETRHYKRRLTRKRTEQVMNYVRNIRSYYQILARLGFDEEQQAHQPENLIQHSVTSKEKIRFKQDTGFDLPLAF